MVSAAETAGEVNDTEMPSRWLCSMDGSEESRREAMMWADLSGPVANDPLYPGLRRHYRERRLMTA